MKFVIRMKAEGALLQADEDLPSHMSRIRVWRWMLILLMRILHCMWRLRFNNW